MTDQPARLRVVGGTDVSAPEPTSERKKRAPRRQPMKDVLKPFTCAKCSEETGIVYDQMVQVLRNPHEANGKLIDGALWWACARCLTPYYLIRRLASGKKK